MRGQVQMGVFVCDIEGGKMNVCVFILHWGSKGEWLCLYVTLRVGRWMCVFYLTLREQGWMVVFVCDIEGEMWNMCVCMWHWVRKSEWFCLNMTLKIKSEWACLYMTLKEQEWTRMEEKYIKFFRLYPKNLHHLEETSWDVNIKEQLTIQSWRTNYLTRKIWPRISVSDGI